MTDWADEKAKSVAYNSGAGRSDLIAAALREARAEMGYPETRRLVAEIEELREKLEYAVETEREACALVCDRIARAWEGVTRERYETARDAAAGIRSRSDAPRREPGFGPDCTCWSGSAGGPATCKEHAPDPRIARHDSGDVTGESSLWTTPADEAIVDALIAKRTDELVERALDKRRQRDAIVEAARMLSSAERAMRGSYEVGQGYSRDTERTRDHCLDVLMAAVGAKS